MGWSIDKAVDDWSKAVDDWVASSGKKNKDAKYATGLGLGTCGSACVGGVSNKVGNWSHSALGIYGKYHNSFSIFGGCATYVDDGKGVNGGYQYVTCHGDCVCAKNDNIINSDNIRLFNTKLFCGAPLIKYNLELYLIKKKYNEKLYMDTKGTPDYKKKIIIDINNDSFNMNAFKTENCFLYYKEGINIYTKQKMNPLLKYITPYDRQYGNTYINSANLYTTLVSRKIINDIKNDNFKKNKSKRNLVYTLLKQYTLDIFINIFNDSENVKKHSVMFSIITPLIYNDNYIALLGLDAYNTPIVLFQQYVVYKLIRIQIKIEFLFNLLYKINPTYFNEDNIETYFDYAYEIVNSNNRDEYFTAKKINDFFIKVNNSIIIENTESFDKITISWLNYIDNVTTNKYIYSVSDAPTLLTMKQLESPINNKNIFINTYLNNDDVFHANLLLNYTPCFSRLYTPDKTTQDLYSSKYKQSCDFFGVFQNIFQGFNYNKMLNESGQVDMDKMKNFFNKYSSAINVDETIKKIIDLKQERELKKKTIKKDESSSNCGCGTNNFSKDNENNCDCDTQNNIVSDGVNIINYKDNVVEIIPNINASKFYEINYSDYDISGISLNDEEVNFNKYKNQYCVNIKNSKKYNLKILSKKSISVSILINGTIKYISNKSSNIITFNKKNNQVYIVNLMNQEIYIITVNINN